MFRVVYSDSDNNSNDVGKLTSVSRTINGPPYVCSSTRMRSRMVRFSGLLTTNACAAVGSAASAGSHVSRIDWRRLMYMRRSDAALCNAPVLVERNLVGFCV